jgi:2,3-bisphosphoglycerate-independent phosphoglycerate mutase
VRVAFPPEVVDSLAAYLSRLGMRQLHLAETEKYAHVTYFFNGGVEAQLPGEDRLLVPSRRDVATYDLAPQMSAPEITERLLAAIGSGDYDFVIVNYANPDMVGHTGVWNAAVAAAEVIDRCLDQVSGATLEVGGALVITADHGNIEETRDAAGAPQTQHTTSPVPLVLVGERWRRATLRDGTLADVAPTLCELLAIPPGPSMTGRSLLVG